MLKKIPAKKAGKRPVKKSVAKKVSSRKKVKARKAAKRKGSVLRVTDAAGNILQKIGEVIHYFPKAKAAAVRITKTGLELGNQIYIKGHTTDFKETVTSMQIDHVVIKKGKKGDEIGLMVKSRVRIGDNIYKV